MIRTRWALWLWRTRCDASPPSISWPCSSRPACPSQWRQNCRKTSMWSNWWTCSTRRTPPTWPCWSAPSSASHSPNCIVGTSPSSRSACSWTPTFWWALRRCQLTMMSETNFPQFRFFKTAMSSSSATNSPRRPTSDGRTASTQAFSCSRPAPTHTESWFRSPTRLEASMVRDLNKNFSDLFEFYFFCFQAATKACSINTSPTGRPRTPRDAFPSSTTQHQRRLTHTCQHLKSKISSRKPRESNFKFFKFLGTIRTSKCFTSSAKRSRGINISTQSANKCKHRPATITCKAFCSSGGICSARTFTRRWPKKWWVELPTGFLGFLDPLVVLMTKV